MHIRLRFLAALFAVPAMLVVVSHDVAADCLRHIYNQSGQRWTFQFEYAGSGGQLSGPGDFLGCFGSSDFGCVVAAGDTVAIRFSGQSVATGMSIKDAHGVTKRFAYDSTSVAAIFRGDCQYIQHDGGTGAISMNEPSNGDFSIGGDFW